MQDGRRQIEGRGRSSALIADDQLISDPPATLTGDLHMVGWLNEHLDIITALLRRVVP